MARKVRACVLYGVGLNCENETQRAFIKAGAEADKVLFGRLLKRPSDLQQYDIFAIPGGFSYADDVAAGRVLAIKLKENLGGEVSGFIGNGKPVIGICNGFQALVKAGFLPALDGGGRQEVTLTYNDSGRFEDRWVYLRRDSHKCIWTKDVPSLELPVRHGEGKFYCDDETLFRMEARDMVVFRYAGPGGEHDPAYPLNPNGSVGDVAAICNYEGTVLGIMPHPEGYMLREQHPRWTREELPEEGLGLLMFRNVVMYVKENL